MFPCVLEGVGVADWTVGLRRKKEEEVTPVDPEIKKIKLDF